MRRHRQGCGTDESPLTSVTFAFAVIIVDVTHLPKLFISTQACAILTTTDMLVVMLF